FQRRNLPFRNRQRRIPVARVDVRSALALSPALHLRRRRKRKRGRAANRRAHRSADTMAHPLPRMNRLGLRAKFSAGAVPRVSLPAVLLFGLIPHSDRHFGHYPTPSSKLQIGANSSHLLLDEPQRVSES